ncbi:SEC-C domain-containing protein [Aeromonas veronii]|nr:SEC-C domain-containing protein [Aeromonas veronii]HEH9411160.1 SEC-C domain-containing protein [Aeromonas salmonicida]
MRHAHFLAQRSEHRWWHPSRLAATSPCPCGSGKKYKQCCLH